jgi:DNA-binding NarL/FixJ family response regulator
MLSSESPFEVLRWLRAEPRFAHVPVFVLGSKVVNHEIDEAYALGANSCLLKESELNGFEKIVRAIAAYVGLITTPGCECIA